MAKARKFDLFMGCFGNGITVCNKAVMDHGDYKRVCHIANDGGITWYVAEDYCPGYAMDKIRASAEKEKEKYLEWWNSLPKIKQYEIELERMSLSELVSHLQSDRRKI